MAQSQYKQPKTKSEPNTKLENPEKIQDLQSQLPYFNLPFNTAEKYNQLNQDNLEDLAHAIKLYDQLETSKEYSFYIPTGNEIMRVEAPKKSQIDELILKEDGNQYVLEYGDRKNRFTTRTLNREKFEQQSIREIAQNILENNSSE